MRRIVMFNRVTIEGYFAGPGGSMDWFVMDEELDKEGAGSLAGTDTIILGRRTYELFEKFWPHALDEATHDPHGGGRLSPAMKAMAVFMNETTKLVFSRSLKDVTWKNSRIVNELDPRAIEAMKRQPGKDMIVLGSGTIVSQLTQHGLIDEYQFVVSPLLLGSGQPLLSGVAKRSKLDLQEAKKYRSGNALLRYVISR